MAGWRMGSLSLLIKELKGRKGLKVKQSQSLFKEDVFFLRFKKKTKQKCRPGKLQSSAFACRRERRKGEKLFCVSLA